MTNDTIAADRDTIAKDCLLCGKRFEALTGKAKYCSEACKQKAKRTKELHNDTIADPATGVDKELEASNPGFYKFGDTIRKVKCLVCGKSFNTSLNALQTCSVAHRDELLRNLTGNR